MKEVPARRSRMTHPIPNSYVVGDARLAAGEYPGMPASAPAGARRAKLEALLDAGITVFIDLTDDRDALAPYAAILTDIARERGIDVRHVPRPIRDMDVCERSHMERVLDAIDEHLAAGRGVYVHCWGGVGRTGLVVGCWLARHGLGGDLALAEVTRLFATMSAGKVQRHASWGSPQTPAQRAMVRAWA